MNNKILKTKQSSRTRETNIESTQSIYLLGGFFHEFFWFFVVVGFSSEAVYSKSDHHRIHNIFTDRLCIHIRFVAFIVSYFRFDVHRYMNPHWLNSDISNKMEKIEFDTVFNNANYIPAGIEVCGRASYFTYNEHAIGFILKKRIQTSWFTHITNATFFFHCR